MNHYASQPGQAVVAPPRLLSASLAWKAFAVLSGTGVLALSSYIQVPMVPVPVTMQTLAVTLVGALYGWRLGALTVLAWLAEGAAGLPVLAGGAGGLAHFAGPTAGYLVSYPVMAAMTGWLAERGWSGHRVVRSFLSLLGANALCLLFGWAWLAAFMGAQPALAAGVTPFVVGGVLKSALGAALLKAAARKAVAQG